MGCCQSIEYARVEDEHVISEQAFLQAVDDKLRLSFPDDGIAALERSILYIKYGDDKEVIAREQANLREVLYAKHNAQLALFAKDYQSAYQACCRLIDVAPAVGDLLNEAQLTIVRDALVDAKSEYFIGCHYPQVFRFGVSHLNYDSRMAVYRLVAAHIVKTYERAAAT